MFLSAGHFQMPLTRQVFFCFVHPREGVRQTEVEMSMSDYEDNSYKNLHQTWMIV